MGYDLLSCFTLISIYLMHLSKMIYIYHMCVTFPIISLYVYLCNLVIYLRKIANQHKALLLSLVSLIVSTAKLNLLLFTLLIHSYLIFFVLFSFHNVIE